MKVRKNYKLGDTVWIYGVDCRSDKTRQGTIIKTFHIDHPEHAELEHYVVEISTDIEPILEIRTWKTISQDKEGPVVSIREELTDPDSARKFLSKIGVTLADGSPNPVYYPEDEPSPDQIHAALEKSQADSVHQPLVLKENKSKRRSFPRKKK
jgi:hypothetical protein